MIVRACGWRIEPYQQNGKRCWQLFRGESRRAERYYDTLGAALRFVAEYALRNDEDGASDVVDALDRYDAIVRSIEGAVAQMGGAA